MNPENHPMNPITSMPSVPQPGRSSPLRKRKTQRFNDSICICILIHRYIYHRCTLNHYPLYLNNQCQSCDHSSSHQTARPIISTCFGCPQLFKSSLQRFQMLLLARSPQANAELPFFFQRNNLPNKNPWDF